MQSMAEISCRLNAMEKIRLDKYISNNKGISRSVARKLIFKGQVWVNGAAVKDISYQVDISHDKVLLDGGEVGYKKHVYILMNKPAGVLCATDDKKAKTVIDMLPDEYKKRNVFPVGRLDKNTTGLLVITDDGEFAHNFISPKKHIEKSYIVTLDGEIKDGMAESFANGMTFADGTRVGAAKLVKLQSNKARVIITEGKYHQIKRMFGMVDLGVDALHRERIGQLTLPDGLKEGEFTEIAPETAEKLHNNPICV